MTKNYNGFQIKIITTKKHGAFRRENYGFFDGFNRQKIYFRRLTKRVKTVVTNFRRFFQRFLQWMLYLFSDAFYCGKKDFPP